MSNARCVQQRKVTAPVLLATASLIALLAGMPRGAAEECASQAAPPANLATPSMVYEALSARTNAQLLAMGFLRKPVEQSCAWIYEVRLMTASGSVVELDFNADGLALVGARGPQDDRDAADLVKTLGGNGAVLTTGATEGDRRGKGSASSGQGSGHGGDDDGGEGGGEGGEDGGEGGEGDNSGSGGEGGEGGNSGSGGGGNSGSGGGGEGGEGGGEGGDD